jgi:hypothetical protein
MIKSKYTYVGLAVCAGLAAVIALAVAPGGKSGTPFAFTTVTASQLASDGVSLSDPQSAAPAAAVSSQAVAQAASAYEGGAAVREVHYMHCVDAWARNPSINQDCYAVSLDPSNVVELGSPLLKAQPKPATWEVVMVDPATGNVIDDRAGNN